MDCLFGFDPNVPPLNLSTLRLKSDVTRLFELVLGHRGDRRPVQERHDPVVLGHDLERVPLTHRMDGSLSCIVIHRGFHVCADSKRTHHARILPLDLDAFRPDTVLRDEQQVAAVPRELVVVLEIARTRVPVIGPQRERIGAAGLWLLPQPSGLNANHQLPELTAAFRALRRAAS